MPRTIDITNQVFGQLTAIRPTEERQRRQVVWECSCTCGNKSILVPASALRSGNTTSCGCSRIRDIIDQRFGKLVVIRPTEERASDRSVKYLCKCDCGNSTLISSSSLLKKDGTKSCGCLKTDIRTDLTGQRFGRLTVLSPTNKKSDSHTKWLCVCDCNSDAITVVASNNLQTGNTQSCGCLHLEKVTKHGGSKLPEYQIWSAMIQRCLNPNNKRYKDYGGRGIKVCDRWLEFENFYEDIGPRPTPEHVIDRINNDGPYEKSNCRWATPSESARNKFRNIDDVIILDD